MFDKKKLQFSPGNNEEFHYDSQYKYNSKPQQQQNIDYQSLKQKHILDSYSPQQKDQLILNLVSQIDCLVSEIFNLSNIVDTLMFEQKLAKEKYETLKAKFNTIAMGQQKEDIINSNPYRYQESGQNALRYNKYSKKEMHQLLANADNRSPTSPRRVITSFGIIYKDKLVSQQLLRERIDTLENELAAMRVENQNIKQQLENHNQLTFGKGTDNEEKSSNNSDHESAAKKAFRDYHSIDTMVQRYQEVN